MFIVTEAEAEAIRAAFQEQGELSATVELQRRFRDITDPAKARDCARTIAGWTSAPETPCPVTPPHPGRTRQAGLPFLPEIVRGGAPSIEHPAA